MPSVAVRSGLELSYWDQGPRADRAVVMLPGPTDSWRSYDPVLERIGDHIRVVAVSLRGHGDSSTPATGYRIDDLASDVVPFLDAVGIDRAVLVAHSGSCLAARRVALDAPQRVAGLFLEASPDTMCGNAALVEFVDGFVSQLTAPLDRDAARSFIAGTSSESLEPTFVEQLVDDLVKVPAAVWHEVFVSLLDVDDTGELAALTMPVSLVWGDCDGLVSRQMQDRLAQLIPGATLTVYDGAGHTPRWESPARFARDLTVVATPLVTQR